MAVSTGVDILPNWAKNASIIPGCGAILKIGKD
jgi:hypothetical protein